MRYRGDGRAFKFCIGGPTSVLAVCATLTLLCGCGGAGTATPAGQTATRSSDTKIPDGNMRAEGQSGKFGVFLAASPGGTQDALWATILKVELIDISEKTVTVYEDQDGFTVDLNHLATTHRYALLTAAPAAAGKAYQRVRVTFAKSFQTIEKGALVAQATPLADTVARDDQERPILSFPLDKPRDLGNGKENLVIAFDLGKTKVADGRITPALREGTGDGLDNPTRQEATAFRGTVSEITRTNQETTFTLTLAPNRTLTVQASEATVYENEGPIPSPTLADGKRVTVRGTLAADTKRILAHIVTIDSAEKPAGEVATLRGGISSADAKAGTLAVTVSQVENILPTLRSVTVLLAPDAVLRSAGGLLLTQEQFYDTLKAPNAQAAFAGTYEPVTGALRATRARIEQSSPANSHEAEVQGAVKDLDAKIGKWTADAPTEWQGISVRAEGKGVSIATTNATAYRDEKGDYLAPANFFAAAASSDKVVRVTGLYTDGTLTATRADLLPAPPKTAKAEEKPGTKPDAKAADTEEKATDDKPNPVAKPATGDRPEAVPTPAPVPASPTPIKSSDL